MEIKPGILSKVVAEKYVNMQVELGQGSDQVIENTCLDGLIPGHC